MRHRYDKKHLNRTKSHRKALLSNMSASLFTSKRIITTLAKAKYARRFAERTITFARRGEKDVSARRHVLRYVHNKDAVKLLFDELGPHFKHRNGGYTRIIKIGPRRGDAAPMAILELVGFDDVIETAAPKKAKETKSRLKAAQEATVEEKMEMKKGTEEAVTEPDETTSDDNSKDDASEDKIQENKESK